MSRLDDGVEGILSKQGLGLGPLKRQQDRWMELHGSQLRIYSERPGSTQDLSGCTVSDDGGRAFSLSGPELPNQCLVLTAPSEAEKAVWLRQLRKAVAGELPSAADLDQLQGRLRVLQRELDELARRNHALGGAPGSGSGSGTALGGTATTPAQPALTAAPASRCQSSALTQRRPAGAVQSTAPQSAVPLTSDGGSVVRRGSDQSSSFLVGRQCSAALSTGEDPMAEVEDSPAVAALRQRLEQEREEQRQLREDLHQEIERLQGLLVESQRRMQSAEQEAQELLLRARAARSGSPGGSPHHAPVHHHARTVSDLPMRPFSSAAGTSAESVGYASTALAPGPERGGTEASRPPPSPSAANSAAAQLDSKLVRLCIELRKALYEVKEAGKVDFVEHVATVAKADPGEKFGVEWVGQQNRVRLVNAGLPAHRAGVRPRMRVVQIDGRNTPDAGAAMRALIDLERAKATTFDIVLHEPPGDMALRIEGHTLLAEERDAILVENDELRRELEELRSRRDAASKS
eukprot:TRINITY_DN13200_c0_g1_i1.p1 TRINITY_DN13200_c0_g1~~TRINITY_DN13200_c0_g1_i1.p1  ORF type:complete len:519 (+),score=171.47 TRINITY_DN13200_c0_g1_i1:116-1672(+)